jgi:uncharacterized protein (DUF2062 family)
MPRRYLQKITPDPASLRELWFLRPFTKRLTDPQLWSLHRRGVTYAFGAGLAICFIPLPVHLGTACAVALLWRLNLPVICGTTFLLNPFTAVPVYYGAYRVGAALLPHPRQHFHFVASWHWFTHGLAPVWKPFLLGCLVCAIVCGVLGWLALEILWRWQVVSRYRARHQTQQTA